MGKHKKPLLNERRKIIAGIAACIGGLAFAAYRINTEPVQVRITFEQAKTRPEIRQKYIDQFKSEFSRPYISSVKYTPQLQGSPHAGAGYLRIFDDIGKRKPTDLQIFPTSFEGKISNENEFLNVIVDHEIDGHAKYDYYGTPEFPHTAFKLLEGPNYHMSIGDVVELIAYGDQLVKGTARKVSPEFKAHNFNNYCNHYQNLVKTPRDLPIKDPSVIERALVNGFQAAFFSSTKNSQPLVTFKNGTYYWRVDAIAEIPLPEGVKKRVTLLK